uniref:Uncharacterized protein n=1 Tax=Glossina morsitans morsitans TaxID=37546 RepID=A0A1B0GC33_GLOMM
MQDGYYCINTPDYFRLYGETMQRSWCSGVCRYSFIVICGGDGTVVGTSGSTAKPNNKDYPAVPYSHFIHAFHASCSIKNYNNAREVHNCELRFDDSDFHWSFDDSDFHVSSDDSDFRLSFDDSNFEWSFDDYDFHLSSDEARTDADDGAHYCER